MQLDEVVLLELAAHVEDFLTGLFLYKLLRHRNVRLLENEALRHSSVLLVDFFL